MFPLTNKEPYIKPSGERTTLGDMFAQAGSDISELEQEVDELNEALTDEVVTRSALGAHNLFRIDNHTEAGSDGNGLTWTDNGDGSFSVSGTPTGLKLFEFFMNSKLPVGDYIVNGGFVSPVNLVINSIILRKGASIVRSVPGGGTNPINLTISASDDYDNIVIDFKRGTNGTATSGTIKPWIKLASDSDPTYQPYAMTNKELTDAKIDASQIAPIENGTTASTNYAQGAYFIHDRKFCKAKTSIASGATFTKGTNYEETTVAAELIALA